MTGSASFHEISFPLSVALGASGGPERLTDIVTLGSGREERNARWADSRRRFDAGLGVKSLDDLALVLAFFEERRGRLYGFRFRDRIDWKSCPPSRLPAPDDQAIGAGDGTSTVFQLVKTYGTDPAYQRRIVKPVAGSVRVAVGGTELAEGAEFSVDATSGLVTLATAPEPGTAVTAGYGFDVPVRFDSDALAINMSAFAAGEIPSIPLRELAL